MDTGEILMRFFIAALIAMFTLPAFADCDSAIYASSDREILLIAYTNETDDLDLVIINNRDPQRCSGKWNFGMARWYVYCGDEITSMVFENEGNSAIYNDIALQRRCLRE